MRVALGQSLFDLRGTQFNGLHPLERSTVVVLMSSFPFVRSDSNSRQLAYSLGARDWPRTFIVVIGN